MTRIDAEYDEATTIPLPGADLGAAGVEAWAAAAAGRLASFHSFMPATIDTLARVLARAQHSAASDPATNFLLHEPGTGSWVPLRLTLAEWEPDAQEQLRALWPPAVLAPRLRLASSKGLGTGISATLLDRDDSAHVRWLFVTEGRSLFATLGPISPPVLAMTAARVEDLLDTVRIGGDVWAPSERFDVHALMRSANDPEALWRI